jgi:SMI1/KNR4 family protein SUKH-1
MSLVTCDTNRSGSAPLEALIARCEADRASHMTGSACTAIELRLVEQALGQSLPPAFRLFLSRLGGGVFYLKHEIFGARRVMIHDIELVPDILSFRAWLGPRVPVSLLPIHRADGVIHAIELGDSPQSAVHRLEDPGAAPYPDLAAFLRHVVVP